LRAHDLITGVVCALATTYAAQGNALERIARAYDRDSAQHLYTETHREEYEGGQLVRSTVVYENPQGQEFARKTLDFTPDPVKPGFRLENFRTGHLEEVRHEAKRCEVHFRRSDESEPRVRRLALPDTAIIDAGFRRFVERNWDGLTQGETLEIAYLVPVRLDFVSLRIRQARVEEVDGRTLRTFLIEPPSLLVRLIAPEIELVYADATRSLLRYRGLSNLRDEQGKNYWVRVEFADGGRRVASAD
jgi:hypothetical protein